MVQYLKSNGYTAAVVEMNDGGNLSAHIKHMPDHLQKQSILDANHFLLGGIDIYRHARSIVEAKSGYQYVVCDYGDGSEGEITSFLERDVKVVVGCIKPHEVKLLDPFFSIDGDDINYIFSFVDSSLWDEIRDEMGAAATRTFFAGYAPDILKYAGDDHIYEQLLAKTTVSKQVIEKDKAPKKGWSLSKMFQIKITREEMHEYSKPRENQQTL